MSDLEYKTQTVQTGFSDLEVLSGGNGPALVWLHGEEGQRGWLNHHAHLADTFTVWAPTLPGLGVSNCPEWVQTVPHMAKVLLGALDHASISNCVLGGASLGGWIAAEMASMQPDRFSGLVLAGNQGTPTGHLNTPDIFLTPYRRYISLGYANADTDAFHTLWPDDLDDDAIAIDLEVMELAALLGFKPYMYDRALIPSLAGYKNPALLVWGEKDIITPMEVANTFKDGLSSAEFKTVPNAGHYVHLEQPDAFAANVAAFGVSLSSTEGN